MRKLVTFFMTLLVGASLSYANANTGQVTFEAGYRHDNLNWKHSFPSYSPVVSTSTKFEDIDIFQIGLKGRTTLCYNLYLRASAYWGWILDGDYERSISTYADFSDNYFNGFNGGFHTSDRNDSVIDDKYVYGVNAAIGYPFFFCDCTVAVAPVIGYSFDAQNICVEGENFDFTSDNFGFFYGEFGSECCCHKFQNRWYGPFVGLDFLYRPCGDCWSLYAELEYHWGTFSGKRGVHDFYDFERDHHSRDAHGWVFEIGGDYDLDTCGCECWTVGFSLKFQDWSASRKHHRHDYSSYDYNFFGSSSFDGHHFRQHNKWHSYAVNLTIGRCF